MIIKNGIIFTEHDLFQKMDLSITNVKISELAPSILSEQYGSIDASDCYIIPGLIDLHFHGCSGYDFCDGTSEALEKIFSYQIANGITSLCPATMTLPGAQLQSICKNASEYNRIHTDSPMVGIHLEGPFISRAKKGAQSDAHIIEANTDFLQELQSEANGLIKLVSIAPEETNALSFIASHCNEFKFSLAHTTANYETAKEALLAGASHITHLFNAMPPFSHREPGVIGAAFDDKSCEVEVICDGIHIAASMIRATFQLFSDNRVILISDSMRATGMPDGSYTLGGQAVQVVEGRATLSDGTIAGSTTNLMACVQTAISMQIPPESAIKAATKNPAKSLGIYDEYGSIAPGKVANLLILNKDFTLKKVIYHGLEI